ncbi:FK506-binding protein 2-like [Sycon ciliatum]|uniref:FK506-binding protein 2-like n=1 Tax=Sycon ciliatum TaxID=27933 RepID=UPI0031F69A8A
MVSFCVSVLLISIVALAEAAKKPRGELKIDVLEKPESCSLLAAKGDKVGIHYTGTHTSGEVFDSSKGRSPFSFKLGDGKTIAGFDQGVVGMCIGEKRMVTVPPHLGYGEKGHPPAIPPSATLKFEIELVELDQASVFSSGSFGTTFNTAAPLFLLGVVIYYLYNKAQNEDTSKKRPKPKAARRR